MRARGRTAPLSREGGPSYREAKGRDVHAVPLVLLRVYAQVRLPRGRVLDPFRALCERVGFHGRVAHGLFRTSRPAFFITIFSYGPHRHQIAVAQ